MKKIIAIIVSLSIFIYVLAIHINWKWVQIDYLIPMKIIEKDKHFLPEFQDTGEKNLLVPNEQTESTIYGKTFFTLGKKEKTKKKPDFKVTEIAIVPNEQKRYTKFIFSTNMNFERNEILAFRTGALSQFIPDFSGRYLSEIPLELKNMSKNLSKDLVGLAVFRDRDDVTDRGVLKIKNGLISWEMNEQELQHFNCSSDMYRFFVYQTKPKEIFK